METAYVEEFIIDIPDGGVKLAIFCLLVGHIIQPASLTNSDCCLTTCMYMGKLLNRRLVCTWAYIRRCLPCSVVTHYMTW